MLFMAMVVVVLLLFLVAVLSDGCCGCCCCLCVPQQGNHSNQLKALTPQVPAHAIQNAPDVVLAVGRMEVQE
jgi:hypothetical protein